MPWLIGDANIFIDMEVGGILEAMFRLPDQIAVPDVLFAEELEAQHGYLLEMGLITIEVQATFVREAFRLAGIYSKAGHNDLLALSLAKQEGCPLLTGDSKLREAAVAEQVDVRGTLWLVQAMVAAGELNHKDAATAYERMKRDGRRLPWREVEIQLREILQSKQHGDG